MLGSSTPTPPTTLSGSTPTTPRWQLRNKSYRRKDTSIRHICTVWEGPPEDLSQSGNAYVDQFVHKTTDGPIGVGLT